MTVADINLPSTGGDRGVWGSMVNAAITAVNAELEALVAGDELGTLSNPAPPGGARPVLSRVVWGPGAIPAAAVDGDLQIGPSSVLVLTIGSTSMADFVDADFIAADFL